MRLDKFLVACAVGSRTEVKNFLKAGRVTVNGKKEKSAKLQIDEETDEICFDGKKLDYEEFVYYMMNKPQGVISASNLIYLFLIFGRGTAPSPLFFDCYIQRIPARHSLVE